MTQETMKRFEMAWRAVIWCMLLIGLAFFTRESVANTGVGASVGGTAKNPTFNTVKTGDVTIQGTGKRIRADFSSSPLANRAGFQTSTTNGATTVGIIPNGTSQTSQLNVYNSSDPTNSGAGNFTITATDVRVQASLSGTGSYVPIQFWTGGANRGQVNTSGEWLLGTSTDQVAYLLQLGTNAATLQQTGSTLFSTTPTPGASDALVSNTNNTASLFRWDINGTEKFKVDNNGAHSNGQRIPKFAHVTFNGSGTIQRSLGVDSVQDLAGTGQWRVNLTSGVFSTNPTCTCTTANGSCSFTPETGTNTTWTLSTPSADQWTYMICIGN